MPTYQAEFCFKRMTVENILLSQSIVEDGKNAKNDNIGKIMPCQFLKFYKSFFSSTQILAIEKQPGKYAFSDAKVFISLKIV